MGTKESKQKNPDNDVLKDLGVDPSLFEDPVENEAPSDDEMNFENDPNLASLGKVNTKFDVKKVTSGLNFNDDEPQVEVTEEDLKDPKFLGELAALCDDDKLDKDFLGIEGNQDSDDDMDEDLSPEEIQILKSEGINVRTKEDKMKDKAKKQILGIETLIKEYQSNAIQLSKAGNKDHAIQLLKKANEIKEILKKLESGKPIDSFPMTPVQFIATLPKKKIIELAPTQQKPTTTTQQKPTTIQKPTTTTQQKPTTTTQQKPITTIQQKPTTTQQKSTTTQQKPTTTTQQKPITTIQQKPTKVTSSQTKPLSRQAQIVQERKEKNQKRQEDRGIIKPKNVNQPKKATSSENNQTPTLDELSPVENIVSNDVFEKEIELSNQEVLKYTQQKQKPPEWLINRQQQLQIRLQTLTVQVQTEKISVDRYLDSLRKKIEEEKSKVPSFKEQEKIPYAIAALKRVQIMTEEIKLSLE